MGNCACSREDFEENTYKVGQSLRKAGEYTRHQYNKAKIRAGVKIAEAKESYGPAVNEAVELAKMKMSTYRPEKIEDNSQTVMITKFEETIPLRKMTVDEFERRLKNLIDPTCRDMINEAQLIESFKDVFPEIEEDASLIRQLLMNPVFLDPKTEEIQYNISEILLMGNLYCANTPAIRANRYFELCQIEYDPQIGSADRDLHKNFTKMLEISYVLMIPVYRRFKKDSDVHIPESWIPNEYTVFKEAYEEILESFLDEVFGSKSKMPRDEFIESLKVVNKRWL